MERVFWVGIGCQRGTSQRVIEAAVRQIFAMHYLAEGAIAGMATLDHKANEAGLVQFCRDRPLPLQSFSAETLKTVAAPNPSSTVAAIVGTPSVAEAAALKAVKSEHARSLEFNIQNYLIVPKQIFRMEGHPGAVAIAVAQTAVDLSTLLEIPALNTDLDHELSPLAPRYPALDF